MVNLVELLKGNTKKGTGHFHIVTGVNKNKRMEVGLDIGLSIATVRSESLGVVNSEGINKDFLSKWKASLDEELLVSYASDVMLCSIKNNKRIESAITYYASYHNLVINFNMLDSMFSTADSVDGYAERVDKLGSFLLGLAREYAHDIILVIPSIIEPLKLLYKYADDWYEIEGCRTLTTYNHPSSEILVTNLSYTDQLSNRKDNIVLYDMNMCPQSGVENFMVASLKESADLKEVFMVGQW